MRWYQDGRHFTYEKTDRSHQRFRVIEVEVPSGRTRNILDEKSATFINGTNQFIHYTRNGDEILWASERDGWRHLYLIDATDRDGQESDHQGRMGGARKSTAVDEKKRQVWFRACGKNDGQDPYLIHYYRVNFDGTGLTSLDGGRRHSHGRIFAGQKIPHRHLFARGPGAGAPNCGAWKTASCVCELERADIRPWWRPAGSRRRCSSPRGATARPISGA